MHLLQGQDALVISLFAQLWKLPTKFSASSVDDSEKLQQTFLPVFAVGGLGHEGGAVQYQAS